MGEGDRTKSRIPSLIEQTESWGYKKVHGTHRVQGKRKEKKGVEKGREKRETDWHALLPDEEEKRI